MSVSIVLSSVTANGTSVTFTSLPIDSNNYQPVPIVASDKSPLEITADSNGGFVFTGLTIGSSQITFTVAGGNPQFNGSVNFYMRPPAHSTVVPQLQMGEAGPFGNAQVNWTGGGPHPFNNEGQVTLTGFYTTFES